MDIQKGGYDPKYYAEQYTGKCRVADWMKAQESIMNDTGMSWSILTTGPYTEMLRMVSPSILVSREFVHKPNNLFAPSGHVWSPSCSP